MTTIFSSIIILNTLSSSHLFLQVALSGADSRAHDLEEKNAVLEGQVSDLQERLQLQSGADEQIMTIVANKATQWEVRLTHLCVIGVCSELSLKVCKDVGVGVAWEELLTIPKLLCSHLCKYRGDLLPEGP